MISIKEYMEEGSASTTTTQLPPTPRPTTHRYEEGNRPRYPYTQEVNVPGNIRPRGKRRPLEQPIKFQGSNKGQILNITAHDPQNWTNVLDVWKNHVVADCIRNFNEVGAEEMYRYVETFLGESVKALWEAYKREKPQEFQHLLTLGPNPYNFVNKIQHLVTGKDPNSGFLDLQRDAIVQLEQLSLHDWNEIKPFVQDYFNLCCISGNAFNQELGTKLLRKLPGALGTEITEKWNIMEKKYSTTS